MRRSVTMPVGGDMDSGRPVLSPIMNPNNNNSSAYDAEMRQQAGSAAGMAWPAQVRLIYFVWSNVLFWRHVLIDDHTLFTPYSKDENSSKRKEMADLGS